MESWLCVIFSGFCHPAQPICLCHPAHTNPARRARFHPSTYYCTSLCSYIRQLAGGFTPLCVPPSLLPSVLVPLASLHFSCRCTSSFCPPVIVSVSPLHPPALVLSLLLVLLSLSLFDLLPLHLFLFYSPPLFSFSFFPPPSRPCRRYRGSQTQLSTSSS